MNILEAEKFKTSKFLCKTDFNMAEIKKKEQGYANYPLPKAYVFKSKEEKKPILYKNFLTVGQDAKIMIVDVQRKQKRI